MNKLSILLCSLLSATCTIVHAAAPKDKEEVIQQVEVLDYTATHSDEPISNSVNPNKLKEEDLVDDLDTIFGKAKDNHILLNVILSNQRPPTRQQVAAQAQDKKGQAIKENHDDEKESNESEPNLSISSSPDLLSNDTIIHTHKKAVYKRYILDATGLLNKKAHKTTQKRLLYHIIQTQASHIIPALCQWLEVSKEKHIIDLSISGPICSQCKYLLNVVIGYTKAVKTDAKGCQAEPFVWPMPKLAMQFTNKYILQSGKPLQITQTILDKMIGISKTGTQQLQQELETIKKRLNEVADQHKQDKQKLIQAEKEKKQLTKELNSAKVQLSTKNKELTDTKKQLKDNEDFINKQLNEVADQHEKEKKKLLQTQQLQNKTIAQLKKKLIKAEQQAQESQKLINQLRKKQDKKKPNPDIFSYDATFEKNVKLRKIPEDHWSNKWYLENIRGQLAGLKKALPQMDNTAHKKEAKSIAFELSQLPKIEGNSLWDKYDSAQDRLIELEEIVGVDAKKVIDYNRYIHSEVKLEWMLKK